ncbi:hypothetical protein Btru_058334 [Bulinus truncatus]|nr:hypothetical protein Btru_058334 [Bulinus truncatus]
MGDSDMVRVTVICSMLASAAATYEAGRPALLVVDVQDCFLSNGSLAVDGAEEIIPVINKIRSKYGDLFELTVLTKDYHCPVHVSFASSHPGYNVYDKLMLNYTSIGVLCNKESGPNWKVPESFSCPQGSQTKQLEQIVWPDHCVINVTSGPTSSEIPHSLNTKSDDIIILKGMNCQIDSYSAFYDNGEFSATQLDTVLRDHGIDTLFIAGLTIDYCVYHTAQDAIKLGYKVFVILDATRAVSPNSGEEARANLEKKGVQIIYSDELKLVKQTNLASYLQWSLSGLLLSFLTLMVSMQ